MRLYFFCGLLRLQLKQFTKKSEFPLGGGLGGKVPKMIFQWTEACYTRERNDFPCLRGFFDTMQRQVSLTYY